MARPRSTVKSSCWGLPDAEIFRTQRSISGMGNPSMGKHGTGKLYMQNGDRHDASRMVIKNGGTQDQDKECAPNLGHIQRR